MDSVGSRNGADSVGSWNGADSVGSRNGADSVGSQKKHRETFEETYRDIWWPVRAHQQDRDNHCMPLFSSL